MSATNGMLKSLKIRDF